MRKIICLLFCAVVAFCPIETLFAQGTAFTYQGRLNDSGSPANGNYDFRFAIYDAVTNGNAIGNKLTNAATVVSNGLFVVALDFGPIFTGSSRWLDMGVRTNGNTNAFTVLVPRQQLMPTPYAIFASTASNLSGNLPATQLTGTLPTSAFAGYTNTVALTNGGNQFSGNFNGAFVGTFNGAFYGNGGGVTNVNVTNLTGVLADNQLPANTAFVNSNQTFSGINAFTNGGNSFVGSFFGNGLVGWIPTNGVTVQATTDRGYLLTNSQLVTVTLPVSPNIGDIVRISGPGASGWQVALNPVQSIIGNFLSLAKSYWTLSGVSATPNWNSIASSSDGSHLVAVASGGGIYTSTDSGMTWSGPGGNTANASWRSVASSADGSKLPAAVYAGGIYTNSAGATNWTITSAISANWISLASSADGTKLVAAVSGDGIYISSNSGTTWTKPYNTPASGSWNCVASSADGTKLVAVANGGGIYTSSNSGGNWGATSAYTRNWVSIASSADGSKLVAVITNNGGIYTSINSGGAWTQQTNAPPANWTSVASSSDGSKLAAVVSGGGIYTSSNFGVTWAQQANAPTKNWSSIASSADGAKLAAAVNNTSGGGIYVSQASPQTTTTTVGTTGYIIGGQGSAVELQYIGNNQFMPVSSAGTIWAY